MGRVKLSREERFVRKYLKRNGHLEVLKVFERGLEEKGKKVERKSKKASSEKPKTQGRKKLDEKTQKKKMNAEMKEENESSTSNGAIKAVKLSFAIQKPPERKKIELEPVKAKKRVRKEEETEAEPKTVDIPDDFKKIAKRFGLPEEHLEFFYEHRTSFNWEFKDKTNIHCSERGCRFTTKLGHKCLEDHMISVHNCADFPCDHVDCSYIAYSKTNLNHHRAHFHGHGQKPTENNAHFSCPYPSCKNSFNRPSKLQRHLNIHENNLLTCNYCPYKCGEVDRLHIHFCIHFNIRNFICDVCTSAFNSKHALKMHMLEVHSNDDFECLHCKFTSRKYNDLRKHRKTCEKRLLHSRIL